MDKMQEDAIKRVREMQSANNNRRPQQNPLPTNESPKKEKTQNKEINNLAPVAKDPLEGLFKDKEKLLILLLVMLLSEDYSNTELILALLYIII